MTLSLYSRITLNTNDNGRNFSQSWMRTLETLLPTIQARSDTDFMQVTPVDALKYQGDFYGLLQFKLVQPKYHWIVLRMNGMVNPTDYDGQETTFLLPNYGFVDEQFRLYQTLYRKNT